MLKSDAGHEAWNILRKTFVGTFKDFLLDSSQRLEMSLVDLCRAPFAYKDKKGVYIYIIFNVYCL